MKLHCGTCGQSAEFGVEGTMTERTERTTAFLKLFNEAHAVCRANAADRVKARDAEKGRDG